MTSQPSILYLVKQVELSVRSHLDDMMRPLGMTTPLYTALTVLESHGQITSAQLARSSFVTSQSMADMVLSLEQRGYIERRRDGADRRRLLIGLTAKGRKFLAKHRPRAIALENRMTSGLTSDEAADLRRYLESCRTALHD